MLHSCLSHCETCNVRKNVFFYIYAYFIVLLQLKYIIYMYYICCLNLKVSFDFENFDMIIFVI